MPRLVPSEVQEATREWLEEGDFTADLHALVREGGRPAARAYVLGQVEVLQELERVEEELYRPREAYGQGGRRPWKVTDHAKVKQLWERLSAENPTWSRVKNTTEIASALQCDDSRRVRACLETLGPWPQPAPGRYVAMRRVIVPASPLRAWHTASTWSSETAGRQ